MRDFQGKPQGSILARVLRWFVALFVAPKQMAPGYGARNAERLAVWKGVPCEDRLGYWRLTLEREDGERFMCLIDGRPASRFSDDLKRAAVKMMLDVQGDTSGEVERIVGAGVHRGFDIDEERARFEEQERVRSEGVPS